MMEQEEWRYRLKKRLEDYQATPPDGLWESIGQGLDAAQKTEKHALNLPFSKRAVAAAIGGFLFIGALTLWQLNKQPVTPALSQADRDHAPVENPENTAGNGVSNKDNVKSSANSRIVSGKDLAADMMAKAVCLKEVRVSEEQLSDSFVPAGDKEDEKERVYTGERKLMEKSEPDSSISFQHITERPVMTVKHLSTGRVILGLYIANNMTEVRGSKPVRMNMEMLDVFGDGKPFENAAGVKSAPLFLTDTYEKMEYDMPVSFGLSMSYALMPKWSFSSGLVYTKLNSTLTQVMGDDRIKTVQTLHYIGFPLSFQYSVWERKSFKAYLTAGGQVDMNVSGKAKVDDIEQNLKKDRIQFSVNTSAGIQYNLTPLIGVYAEPGVKCYFKNGSNIRTIYKKYPVNFNLQVGVRVNMPTQTP